MDITQDNSNKLKRITEKGKSVSIQYRNIQVLTREMLRVYQDIFPNIMTEVLLLSQTLILDDNIEHQPDLSTRTVKSVYYDTESLGYLAPKIWKLIPPQLKKVESCYPYLFSLSSLLLKPLT